MYQYLEYYKLKIFGKIFSQIIYFFYLKQKKIQIEIWSESSFRNWRIFLLLNLLEFDLKIGIRE